MSSRSSSPSFNYLLATLLCIAYALISVHTPITILANAFGDDATFIQNGQFLIDGHWFGPYSPLTLVKGPGYPAFLALANSFGLSASLAHAVLHCFAALVFTAVVSRFIRFSVLSDLLLTLLVFHPFTLDAWSRRILRDKIYYAELLLLLATAIAALFYHVKMRDRALWAGLCGTVFGWFWLTREEGAWIAPAGTFLVAIAFLYAWRERQIGRLCGVIFVLIGIFTTTQVGFRLANLWAYKAFVAVDVKEKNFSRALGAIHSVRSGGVKPFVSVTRAARERIYAVSPSFASLSDFIEGPGAAYAAAGCLSTQSACNDIGAGWFLWVLRGAAQAAGHYKDAAETSAFFGKLADEITAACATGALECKTQLVPEMPPFHWADVMKQSPGLFLKAIYLLLPRFDPSLENPPGSGASPLFDDALRFLNYPKHTRSADDRTMTTYTIKGWYHHEGQEWMAVTVKTADGEVANITVDRLPSPDIAEYFKDPLSSKQRFSIRTVCSGSCILTIRGDDGASVERRLAQVAEHSAPITVGSGELYVDEKSAADDPSYSDTREDILLERARAGVLRAYPYLLYPVFLVGLIAFLSISCIYRAAAVWNPCYVLAATCWILVISRVTLLVIIAATAFPAIEPIYIAPAHFALVGAAVLSIAAFLQLYRNPSHSGSMAPTE